MSELHDELNGRLHGAAPALEHLERLPVLERVIREGLRLFPPVSYYTRATAEPMELGGRRLRKGCTVVFSHYITHRMPDIFPNPERFQPERWLTAAPTPYEYLPFGIGPRMCIGITYATVVIRVVLPMLLQPLPPDRRAGDPGRPARHDHPQPTPPDCRCASTVPAART